MSKPPKRSRDMRYEDLVYIIAGLFGAPTAQRNDGNTYTYTFGVQPDDFIDVEGREVDDLLALPSGKETDDRS